MTDAALPLRPHGNGPTRVFIVAAVQLYMEGLATTLAHDPGIEVVGGTRVVPEAAAELAALQPHVILLSAPLQAASSRVRQLRALAADARIIALAVHDVDDDVVAWAEVGVDAFVTNDASVATLVDTIQRATRGELVCTPRTAAALLRRVQARALERSLDGAASRLTRRERQIAELMVRGLSNKEIASMLQIELPTVKNHVHHILEKLGVTRRGQAAACLRALS